MDPEKDLLDIPTELEIPIEEEIIEPVVPVDEQLNENIEIVNDSIQNGEESVVDNSMSELVVPDLVNEKVNEIEESNNNEMIVDSLDVENNFDLGISLDDNNDQLGVQNITANEEVNPFVQEETSVEEESNTINNVEIVDNNVSDSDGVNISDGVESTVSVPIDSMPINESNNELGTDGVDVQNSGLSEGNGVEVNSNNFNNQSVPTIQPLDSTTPPEELDIKVDDSKKKKPKKKISIIKLLIILIIIGGIGVAVYFLLPNFLGKTKVDDNTNYLEVRGVSFKDTFESAYTFVKVQTDEVVIGENGTYSVDNDHIVLKNKEDKTYNIVLKDIYVEDVFYFGTCNGIDYLRFSDMFGNIYIYGVSNITKNIELNYQKDIITVPTGVNIDNIEMGVYPDGSGVFFISRNDTDIKIINKVEDGYTLSDLPNSILRGQEISVANYKLSKENTEKIKITGVVLEYTGSVYVYDNSSGTDVIYQLNDVSDDLFNAKEIYLVSNAKNNTFDLFIFFESDGKEYVNTVNLLESDFKNGDSKISNYNKAVKSKELSNEKVLITLEDGSVIVK